METFKSREASVLTRTEASCFSDPVSLSISAITFQMIALSQITALSPVTALSREQTEALVIAYLRTEMPTSIPGTQMAIIVIF